MKVVGKRSNAFIAEARWAWARRRNGQIQFPHSKSEPIAVAAHTVPRLTYFMMMDADIEIIQSSRAAFHASFERFLMARNGNGDQAIEEFWASLIDEEDDDEEENEEENGSVDSCKSSSCNSSDGEYEEYDSASWNEESPKRDLSFEFEAELMTLDSCSSSLRYRELIKASTQSSKLQKQKYDYSNNKFRARGDGESSSCLVG